MSRKGRHTTADSETRRTFVHYGAAPCWETRIGPSPVCVIFILYIQDTREGTRGIGGGDCASVKTADVEGQ
jgi:hypothetical protein